MLESFDDKDYIYLRKIRYNIKEGNEFYDIIVRCVNYIIGYFVYVW